jgi:DNA modification methylase
MLLGRAPTPEGMKPKDLMMVPARVAIALQDDGWYLRSEIIWAKPNPMPESVTDRPTSAHEKVYLLTKRPTYFYDAEAIREENSSPAQHEHNQRYAKTYDAYDSRAGDTGQPGNVNNVGIHARPGQAGRNKRNVWTIATTPYPGAHFATFPPKLVEPMILAGTSAKGCCPACGSPWVRQTETSYDNPGNRTTNGPRSLAQRHETAGFAVRLEKRVETLGWSPSCACPAADPIPCTVLDPFGGAGTVALEADRLGRDAILVELNPTYAKMAEDRIRGAAPMFATVEVA